MFASLIAGGVGLLAVLFIFAFALFLTIFWIWMLVDAIRNRALSEGEKIGWVLAIVFLHFLGALLYSLIGRRRA